jgi:nucleoside-diphosphate-sugar epimerase
LADETLLPIPQRALVTGATGFIGGALVRRLVAAGCETTLLVRPGGGNDGRLTDLAGRVAVRAAAATDMEGIAAIVAESQAQVVFHLGAHNISAHRPADIVPLIESNVTLSTGLCDAMVRSGCPTIVAMGSAWQHGDGAAYRPICLYAAAKQAMQDVFDFYARSSGLRCVALKLFHAYGPGDPRARLLTQLCRAAVRGGEVKMTEGRQIIDLTHVDDVVAALLTAAGPALPGPDDASAQSFSIASERPMMVRDLVALVERIADRPVRVLWGAYPYKPLEFFHPVSMGARLPGWAPRVSLEQGIANLIAAEYADTLGTGAGS